MQLKIGRRSLIVTATFISTTKNVLFQNLTLTRMIKLNDMEGEGFTHETFQTLHNST